MIVIRFFPKVNPTYPDLHSHLPKLCHLGKKKKKFSIAVDILKIHLNNSVSCELQAYFPHLPFVCLFVCFMKGFLFLFVLP